MPDDAVGDQIKTVVLFDGVCGLCSRSVDWMIARDPKSHLLFLSIQSPAGQTLVEYAGLDPQRMTTMIAIRKGRVLVRSNAVLEMGSRLRTPLARLAPLARVIPRPLRDVAYRLLARSRYLLFGKRDTCRMPTPDLLAHFLDPDDTASARAAAGIA